MDPEAINTIRAVTCSGCKRDVPCCTEAPQPLCFCCMLVHSEYGEISGRYAAKRALAVLAPKIVSWAGRA